MNRKQLIFVLIALVVLGGAGLVMLNRNKETWNATPGKQGQKLLDKFQVNDVAAIRIKGATEVNLARKDDLWRVQERGDYPANFSQIGDFLLKISDLKITQSEPIGQSQLGRMELEEPGKGAKSATLVEFKDSKGAVLQSVLLGKKHSQKSENAPASRFGGDEGFANGRYVMLRGDQKNVLLVSDALAAADPKPDQWISKDFFKVEKPKSISLVSTNAANSWKISRETEAGDWTLADAKPGEVLDKNKASSLASTLSNPSFIDVATGGETNLDKPQVLTIETFDKFTYTIKAGGKTPEGNGYLMVSVTANLPKEPPPDKDKKPEDKPQIIKAFYESLKPLQEKLTREKSEEKWTYIVASWTLEPLLRDRAQLLEEKKEEKKDEAATPPPSAPSPPSLRPSGKKTAPTVVTPAPPPKN